MPESDRARYPSATALVLLAALLGGCATVPDPEGSPALWRVDHAGQRTWLFGTIHNLPPEERDGYRLAIDPLRSRLNGRLPDSAWRTEVVMDALRHADELVLEIDEPATPSTLAQITRKLSTSAPQSSLLQQLPDDIRGELRHAAEARGVADNTLARMDAPGIVFLLSMFPPRQPASARQGKSVESWLRLAARLHHLQVTGLESSTMRIESLRSRFAQMGAQKAMDTVLDLIRTTDNGAGDRDDDYDYGLYRIWLHGETAAFERLITDFARKYPGLYAASVQQRHDNWMEPLTGMIADANDEFIAVGIAHLVGADSLIKRLRSRGYVVRRVQ